MGACMAYICSTTGQIWKYNLHHLCSTSLTLRCKDFWASVIFSSADIFTFFPSRHCETPGLPITVEGHNHFTLQKHNDYTGAKVRSRCEMAFSRANFPSGRYEWGGARCRRRPQMDLEELRNFGIEEDTVTLTLVQSLRSHYVGVIFKVTDTFISSGQLGI